MIVVRSTFLQCVPRHRWNDLLTCFHQSLISLCTSCISTDFKFHLLCSLAVSFSTANRGQGAVAEVKFLQGSSTKQKVKTCPWPEMTPPAPKTQTVSLHSLAAQPGALSFDRLPCQGRLRNPHVEALDFTIPIDALPNRVTGATPVLLRTFRST